LITCYSSIVVKKHLLYLLFVTLLLFASCAKKECCDFPPIPNFILAQKNGVEWAGDPSDSAIERDTTIVTGNNTTAGQQEIIGFKLRVDDPGYYTLKNNEGYYYIIRDNATIARYKLSPTHSNTVVVVAFNATDKILQGYFDLKFVKTFDIPAGTQPDSISFLSGKFKVALHN
jgi:hypothetical protein